MGNDKLNILLVDDHEMILEGYKNVLSKVDLKHVDFSLETAQNCDWAWDKIESGNYQIVFLDINFPVTEKSKILSGEDLGIKIKRNFPNIKVVILTVIEEPFRLQNILSNIDPDGFLLKGETNARELRQCIETVIYSPPYYSSKITKLLRSGLRNNFSLDETDRMILYQLSLGTKTKDITEFVHLSLRAVENRKKRLREVLGVTENGNKALLERARESGYD